MPLTREQFQSARNAGFSVEQIVGFEKRRQTEQPLSTQKPIESIATQGFSYIKEHPFKSFFDPAAKTITGKSLLEHSQETPIPTRMTGNRILDTASAIGMGVHGFQRDVAALGADIATSPASLATAGIGAISKVQTLGKGIFNGVKSGVGNIGKFFNFNKKGLDLATKVRGVAAEAKSSAVEQFGKTLDDLANANPDKSISLQEVIDGIKKNLIDPESGITSEAKSVFKRTPVLKDMLKNIDDDGYISPNNVSLGKTQEIINYINTKIPKNIKYNNLDVLDVQNDIRAAQLDAFPEMQQAREAYGKFANDYNLVKSALKPGSTLNTIKNNFSGNVEKQEAAKRILGPILNQMKNYRRQIGTIDITKKGAIAGVGAESLYLILKKLFGN